MIGTKYVFPVCVLTHKQTFKICFLFFSSKEGPTSRCVFPVSGELSKRVKFTEVKDASLSLHLISFITIYKVWHLLNTISNIFSSFLSF